MMINNKIKTTFQIRTLVGVFAADSQALRDYVTSLHQLSSKLVAAHNQLTSAYQDLSKHLKAYKNIVSRPWNNHTHTHTHTYTHTHTHTYSGVCFYLFFSA